MGYPSMRRGDGLNLILMFSVVIFAVLIIILQMPGQGHVQEITIANATFHQVSTTENLYEATIHIKSNITVLYYSFNNMEYKHPLFHIGQKYPLKETSIPELVTLAEKTHVIYYNNKHIYTLVKRPVEYIAYV